MNVVSLKMAAAGDETNPDAPRVTFQEFWRKYPRKVARFDAEIAWAKVRPEDYPSIMRDLETRQWPEKAYTLHAATYLNRKRWMDEGETAVSMGQCVWNQNGTREEGKPRCADMASVEKRGLVYCKTHAERA